MKRLSIFVSLTKRNIGILEIHVWFNIFINLIILFGLTNKCGTFSQHWYPLMPWIKYPPWPTQSYQFPQGWQGSPNGTQQ
jgi:hypothetical protein